MQDDGAALQLALQPLGLLQQRRALPLQECTWVLQEAKFRCCLVKGDKYLTAFFSIAAVSLSLCETWYQNSLLQRKNSSYYNFFITA